MGLTGVTYYPTKTGNTLVACPNWTFSVSAWLARWRTGTTFPGSAAQAIWLNEYAAINGPKGSMSRSLTGLTVGHTYRVSVQAWTDNKTEVTALGLTFGPTSVSFPLAAGSGPQSISSDVCATSSALTLSLYENGSTVASPVVTNVELVDLGTPCTIAGFYTVGGSVTGLASGRSLTLLNNGGDALTVNANGTFTFSAALASGRTYTATVCTQPTDQTCTVSSGSGTVASANITNIVVTCVAAVVPVGVSAPTVVTPVPVPVDANWALALTTLLLGLLVRRHAPRRRSVGRTGA